MENTNHKSSKALKWHPPRHTPPTAVPIQLRDLWGGISAFRHSDYALDNFTMKVANYLGIKTCFLVSSGRAALTLILIAAKHSSNRAEVIIPAYGCPTVTQSILAADLTPIYCDVSTKTLDLDREDLLNHLTDNTLAIIPTHLYGLAQDISDLLEIGQSQEIYIIEDTAQSFGASVKNNYVGTFGDAGFFSLGRGKCLPTGHGGMIVAQGILKNRMEDILQEFLEPISSYDIKSLISYTAYGAAILPLFWWFIVRSNFNPANDGMKFEVLPDITIQGFSKTQAGIGSSILNRYKEINKIRRQNALRMMSQILEIGSVRLPEIHLNANPVFLRLPIICNNQHQADNVFNLLNQCGIGVSKSYTHTIPDVFSKYLEIPRNNYPGASFLAKCLLTLPTHQYVRENDFTNIKEALASFDKKGINICQ